MSVMVLQSGRNCSYSVYNRVHTTFLQIRVVYSVLNNILCTIDCNNTIYGWRIDGKECLFEVSRHKALITEIITIDKHNLFATCSLDRRVVLWSQSTRRVKGVLLGHKRGITHMSCGRDTLLTSGFECEARWVPYRVVTLLGTDSLATLLTTLLHHYTTHSCMQLHAAHAADTVSITYFPSRVPTTTTVATFTVNAFIIPIS